MHLKRWKLGSIRLIYGSVAATKLSSKFHAKVSINFRHERLNLFYETFCESFVKISPEILQKFHITCTKLNIRQISAKSKFCTVQYIQFLIVYTAGSDETFPKFAESLVESFAKILTKFHELKISTKKTTIYGGMLVQPYTLQQVNQDVEGTNCI